jgi:hypothetical protein
MIDEAFRKGYAVSTLAFAGSYLSGYETRGDATYLELGWRIATLPKWRKPLRTA